MLGFLALIVVVLNTTGVDLPLITVVPDVRVLLDNVELLLYLALQHLQLLLVFLSLRMGIVEKRLTKDALHLEILVALIQVYVEILYNIVE